MPLGSLLTAISSLAPRARRSLPSDQTPATGICYDTRKLAPGEIFVCLRGQERDSHALAADAYARGALLVVGEDETVGGDGPYLQVDDSRKAVALLADRFYDHPSARMTVLAATGTNGKTSTTWMCEAVFREAGIPAAVLGTLGVGSPGPQGDPSLLRSLGHTTPEAPDLQATLHQLAAGGVRAVAMEVSSHGLELRRTFATRFVVAIFTNLTPDHLDFHHTMEAYAEAKRRLFLATERGCDDTPLIAVVAGDDPWTRTVLAGSNDRIIRFGRDRAHDIHPLSLELGGHGIRMRVRHPAGETDIVSPLLGEFQVDNLLAAFGATVAAGIEPEVAARGLGRLRGIPGRMERVDAGQPFLVVVDYAHTPDALRRALASLRPFTSGRLIVVFGCGGERDRAKRPEMGREAGLGADRVILTDDNPRREDPEAIRADARIGLTAVAAPFIELGDRGVAIARALAEAEPGDAVLIAGKGAEEYQIRGTESLPFDDREVARSALAALRAERGGQFEAAHFTIAEIAQQAGGAVHSIEPAPLARRIGYHAIATDSRRVAEGDFFIALRGERFDAHDFLPSVAEHGAAAALVDRPAPDVALTQVVVDDTLRALQRWGAARRAAWGETGPLIGLTGSSGKTTTKDLLAHLLRADGPVWATQGNFNNHFGVPLTLLGLSPVHQAAVIEMGMNHAGEIELLSGLSRPTCGLITGIGTAHIGHLGSREAILAAKFELLRGLASGAPLVLHHDRWVLDRLPVEAGRHPLVTFGLEPEATIAPVGPVEWSLTGTRFTTPLTGPIELSLLGRGALLSALGALATLSALGRDPREYAARLARVPRRALRMEPRRHAGVDWLLDCYNASPESTRLAFEFLRIVPHPGRRIAVLGALGELGPESATIHADLGADLQSVDLALFVGEEARAAHDACPVAERSWFAEVEAAAAWLAPRLRTGDLVLLKGSRRMALERLHAAVTGQAGGTH